LPQRQFGGVGLMVKEPGIRLTFEEAKKWSAEGLHADRALQFAVACCNSLHIQTAYHMRIVSPAPQHVGLGTGTQLGMAIASALHAVARHDGKECNVVQMAALIGRGQRSAIGIHGFEHGGFLVEAGKRSDAEISPLLIHCDFPTEWSILLVVPRDLQGVHGSREAAAFSSLKREPVDERATEAMCRIVLLGMVPALIERDLETFGEALHEFNYRAGTMFRPFQGGVYSHPRVEQIVTCLREFGIPGVGQSSWGPATFAVTDQAHAAQTWLVRKGVISSDEAIIATPCNHGAETTIPTKSADG
jgi:beta-RFAP synthase